MSWLVKTAKSPKQKISDEVKRLSSLAFTIEHQGHEYKFYELSTLHDMPAKRFQRLTEFIDEAKMSVQKDELHHYLDELYQILNVKVGEELNITDAKVLVKWLKARTRISMDVDLVMKVLAAVFIMEGEDPLDYDYDINQFKIKLFEEYGPTAFFLIEPIGKYLKLINISQQDISQCLEVRNRKKQALNELDNMGISIFNMQTRTTTSQNST